MTLDYSLFQPDIFSFFQEGYPVALGERLAPDIYFARAIATACKDIAERFDCSLTLSENRLEETRLHWARDLQRIDIANSKIPDHFKTTGFLAYWLRRRIVVQYVICKETAIPVEQTYFLNFANEVCAFTIAFQLSLYFQYRHWFDTKKDAADDLASLELNTDLRNDITTLLKHKNVSPHSLYLVLAALFADLQRPRIGDKVVKLATKRG